MLGQRDDAERDRHPRLDARRGVLLVGIALDPHQFGRAAADIEQDGAAPFRSSSGEQPITASAASVSRSITSSRMPVSPATRSRKLSAFDAARQASVAISRSRFAFLDWILSRQMLKAAMARSIAASLMQPVAEIPSPSRMIREKESTTRNPSPDRAGDQEPAVVGAEVERGIDAGSSPALPDRTPQPCGAGPGFRAAQGRREAALHRSSKCLSAGRSRPTRNFRSRKL